MSRALVTMAGLNKTVERPTRYFSETYTDRVKRRLLDYLPLQATLWVSIASIEVRCPLSKLGETLTGLNHITPFRINGKPKIRQYLGSKEDKIQMVMITMECRFGPERRLAVTELFRQAREWKAKRDDIVKGVTNAS